MLPTKPTTSNQWPVLFTVDIQAENTPIWVSQVVLLASNSFGQKSPIIFAQEAATGSVL